MKIRSTPTVWIWLIFVLVGISEVSAMDAPEATRRLEESERRARSDASITYMNASAPLGYFLLIRKGTDLCAVRFTEFHRGHDATSGTIFRSGEETRYAGYDWYYQGDGSGDLEKPTTTTGHETLVRKPMVGLGRLAVQTGNTTLRCGPFRLDWHYPNKIAFYLNPPGRDEAVEMAPTKWQTIGEINVRDQRLKWYRYDVSQRRQDRLIPIDDLW